MFRLRSNILQLVGLNCTSDNFPRAARYPYIPGAISITQFKANSSNEAERLLRRFALFFSSELIVIDLALS
jgi:hypothetical protein